MSTVPQTPAAAPTRAVALIDLDVPFGRLVLFFIKAGLAAIPALIVVMLSLSVIGAAMRGLFRVGYWGAHGYWW